LGGSAHLVHTSLIDEPDLQVARAHFLLLLARSLWLDMLPQHEGD
jgi:hypothetical protein